MNHPVLSNAEAKPAGLPSRPQLDPDVIGSVNAMWSITRPALDSKSLHDDRSDGHRVLETVINTFLRLSSHDWQAQVLVAPPGRRNGLGTQQVQVAELMMGSRIELNQFVIGAVHVGEKELALGHIGRTADIGAC